MRNKVAFLFIVFFTLVSCKSIKNVTETDVNTTMSVQKLVSLHNQTFPSFTTLASRVQVEYEDTKNSQSITVSLRMEKDKTIWIKASILGITLVKALITPERVSYYETISNTYFDGDFSLLSEWLGTPLDFNKAQSILLGQSIFSVDKNYQSSVYNNTYKIEPKKQPLNFIHSLFIDPTTYRVVSGSVYQPNEKRLFSLRYDEYQTLEGGYYPSKVFINASEKEENTKITVTYKSVDINANVGFSFTIPSGYEPIKLSK